MSRCQQSAIFKPSSCGLDLNFKRLYSGGGQQKLHRYESIEHWTDKRANIGFVKFMSFLILKIKPRVL